MFVDDDAYPSGRRLPMTPAEQSLVDADMLDALLDTDRLGELAAAISNLADAAAIREAAELLDDVARHRHDFPGSRTSEVRAWISLVHKRGPAHAGPLDAPDCMSSYPTLLPPGFGMPPAVGISSPPLLWKKDWPGSPP